MHDMESSRWLLLIMIVEQETKENGWPMIEDKDDDSTGRPTKLDQLGHTYEMMVFWMYGMIWWHFYLVSDDCWLGHYYYCCYYYYYYYCHCCCYYYYYYYWWWRWWRFVSVEGLLLIRWWVGDVCTYVEQTTDRLQSQRCHCTIPKRRVGWHDNDNINTTNVI